MDYVNWRWNTFGVLRSLYYLHNMENHRDYVIMRLGYNMSSTIFMEYLVSWPWQMYPKINLDELCPCKVLVFKAVENVPLLLSKDLDTIKCCRPWIRLTVCQGDMVSVFGHSVLSKSILRLKTVMVTWWPHGWGCGGSHMSGSNCSHLEVRQKGAKICKPQGN